MQTRQLPSFNRDSPVHRPCFRSLQRTLGSTIWALRISQGLGAGIACTDDICGALSGAIMVIGLWYGGISADDNAAKEKTYAVVGEFLQEFKARNGSVACTGLLGHNLSDQQRVAEA